MGKLGRFILWAFASLGLTVALGIATAVYFVSNYRHQVPDIPEKTAMWLDLSSPVVEKQPAQAFLPGKASGPVFLEMIEAIDKAADDSRIQALVTDLGFHGMGLGQIQELRAALARFRETGKPAIIFAEDIGSFGGGTLDYYLASAFDEIWIQPSGGVGLTGLSLELPYFAEALDKLEITPRFEQRHEFKGGADPFTKTGMSLPVRRSMGRLVDGWMAQIIRDVENDRPKLNGLLSSLIDNGPYLAADAWTAGLVDKLGYWDEFEREMNHRFGLKENKPVSTGHYLAALQSSGGETEDTGSNGADPATIALIYGIGSITPDQDEPGIWSDSAFSPYRVAQALTDAREDDQIDAVLLRIDSPGGTYPQADMVWREVQRLRESGKPVVALLGNMAASGGYFAAMGADHIIAQPGTLTGSIGVYAGKFATERLWEKLGVKWDRVQSGRNAGMWSMVSDFSPSELQKFREFLDFVYTDFSSKAAKDRQLSMEQIDKAARGRIWTGEDALQVGLVDEIGGIREAEESLQRLLQRDEDTPMTLIPLPRPPSAYEQLQQFLGADNPLQWVAARAFNQTVTAKAEAVLGDLTALKTHAGLVQLPPMRIAR